MENLILLIIVLSAFFMIDVSCAKISNRISKKEEKENDRKNY